MGSAKQSLDNAENACINFLADLSGLTLWKQLKLGDVLPPDTGNAGAFQISGGPDQIQNFQNTGVSGGNPPCQYLMDWQFVYQAYNVDLNKSRTNAHKVYGNIANGMPAYKDSTQTNDRGIPPNVLLFEMVAPPIFESVIVDDGSQEIVFVVLLLTGRVAFSNKTQ